MDASGPEPVSPPDAAPSHSQALKHVLNLVDERVALRETRNLFWKSSALHRKEAGIWSRYPSQPPGAEGHVVYLRQGFQLPLSGAVMDAGRQLFRGSMLAPESVSPELDHRPALRSKRGGWVFYPQEDTLDVGAAAFFCLKADLSDYARFLLGAMVRLTMLDDVGALSQHRPTSPPLDAWRKEFIRLLLGADAGHLREVEAPVVRFEGAVFANLAPDTLTPPTPALMLMRERLLFGARAFPQRMKAPKRIFLTRRGVRSVMEHKRLFAELRELGFSIIDPSALSPADQITLMRSARLIVGYGAAALANIVFAQRGARVVELRRDEAESAPWVRTLCDALGHEWLGVDCPRQGEVAPLDALVKAPCEQDLRIEDLAKIIRETE